MGYDIIHDGSAAEVRLAGRLTFAENGRFRTVLSRLQAKVSERVTLDLSRVDYIDSAGLGLLLVARDAVAGQGGRAELQGACGQVGRIFALARFPELFQPA
jgi:HptB-dependent secretion and biofilm anti anti-sigma factor